ncbi:hypothetical protein [Desulfosporosinus fructosivorans]|nr:hypothetical protein [Desulfosporosinus fructosivorans]
MEFDLDEEPYTRKKVFTGMDSIKMKVKTGTTYFEPLEKRFGDI